MYSWKETPISMSDVRHPKEKTAQALLFVFAIPVYFILAAYLFFIFRMSLAEGLIIVVFGGSFFFLLWWIGEVFALAHFRTHGVLVSPQQFPKLDAMTDNFCKRLGLKRPEIYVMQNSLWNAFATKLAGRRIVVLLSGAIDSIQRGGREAELGFLLGHELGHHAAGHFDVLFKLMRLGAWFPFVGLWHWRCMELTCDRVALACCGDSELALRGLVNMTVGSSLAKEANIEEIVRQWDQQKNSLVVQIMILFSFYPPHLARVAEVKEAVRTFGLYAAPAPVPVPVG